MAEKIRLEHAWLHSGFVCGKDGGEALYVLKYRKWHPDVEPMSQLYEWLKEQDQESYFLVDACHDYPDDTSGDAGGWHDNPFSLTRVHTVSLSYETT